MKPSAPSGTVTRLATFWPSTSALSDDTVGCADPVGHTVAKPAAPGSTIVMLTTTAEAAAAVTPLAFDTAAVTGAIESTPFAGTRRRNVSVRVSSTRIGLIGAYRLGLAELRHDRRVGRRVGGRRERPSGAGAVVDVDGADVSDENERHGERRDEPSRATNRAR